LSSPDTTCEFHSAEMLGMGLVMIDLIGDEDLIVFCVLSLRVVDHFFSQVRPRRTLKLVVFTSRTPGQHLASAKKSSKKPQPHSTPHIFPENLIDLPILLNCPSLLA